MMLKKNLYFLILLFSSTLLGLDYELQFENESISAAKVKMQPQEEIGLHRDVYPQVVIGLKGGTITRIEQDGRHVQVEFPTGVAVYREKDPEDQLHRSVNNSDAAIELMIIQLKK